MARIVWREGFRYGGEVGFVGARMNHVARRALLDAYRAYRHLKRARWQG